jgi:multicomponent Na+:H+ antiporter subunit E
MNRAVLSLVLVAAAFALMIASADAMDLALAVAVAAVLLYVFRRFLFGGTPSAVPGLAGRVLAFPLFAFAVGREITLGTWQVAAVVLHLRPLRSPGIVAVPFGDRTDTGVKVTALAATLSPGEFLVDLDHERRVMLMHVIDASDPDAVRRHHEHLYERYQRRVFP